MYNWALVLSITEESLHINYKERVLQIRTEHSCVWEFCTVRVAENRFSRSYLAKEERVCQLIIGKMGARKYPAAVRVI